MDERSPTQPREVHGEPVLLHEREQWFVLNKPAGWHTVTLGSAADDATPTVEAWLRRERPELASIDEAGIVHRLDRSTSGCLLVARSATARSALRAAISELGCGIRKAYLAIAPSGLATTGAFALHFRGRHRRSAKVTVSDTGDERDLGRCRWRVLGSTPGGELVEVELLGPGRRHQIRAGFAHLGCPLRGDALYGGGAPLPGLDGAALHAWRIEIDGAQVDAPLPRAWSQFQSLTSRRTDGASITRPTADG